jgi:serine phosphatase RsbU (regulator of sigma subunit)
MRAICIHIISVIVALASCFAIDVHAQQTASSSSNNLELAFVQAEQLMSAGRYEEALKPALEAYRLSVADHQKMSTARAALFLSECYRETKQFNDALEFGIRCAAASDGTSFEYAIASRLSLIHLFRAWNATEKELEYINSLMSFQGLQPELHEQLLDLKIDCLVKLNKNAEAIPLLDQCITTSKSEKSGMNWIALTEQMVELQREAGNLSAALGYQYIIVSDLSFDKSGSDYCVQVNNYGELLAQTGDHQKAVEYFVDAIQHLGSSPSTTPIVFINKAASLFRLGKNQQAIQDLEAASAWSLSNKSYEHHALAELTKSKILAAQGDFVSALNAAQNALSSAEKLNDKKIKVEIHQHFAYLNYKLGARAIGDDHKAIAQQLQEEWLKEVSISEQEHEALLNTIANKESNIYSNIKASEAENLRLEQQLKIANQEKDLTQLQLEKQRQQAALKDEQVAREKATKELALIQAALMGEQQKRTITELEQARTEEQLKLNTLKLEQNEKQRNLELLQKQNELLNSENKVRELETQNQKKARNIGIAVLALTVMMLVLALSAFFTTRKKNKVIAENNEEIKQINNQLRYQNEEITSSITYARNFQDMIIPGEDYLRKLMPDSFLIYAPLENVSGDIPFIMSKENRIYIGAIDCIGHGVPAAMLSFMAYYNLSQLIQDKPNYNVSELLTSLHHRLASSLPKTDDVLKFSAGVDIGLCCLNTDTLELQFAGANQPLIVVSPTGIERIQGDKCTLGDPHSMKQSTIQVHNRKLNHGDKFFMFSDGLIHQFGGTDGKRKYGLKRLLAELEEYFALSAEQIKDQMQTNFSAWKKDIPQTDDVMLLGMTVVTKKSNLK